MKDELVSLLKALFTGLGVGTLIGIIGSGIRQVWEFKRLGKFSFSSLIVSMLVGGFVGWIVGQYIDDYAIIGISAVLSDKIFEFILNNSNDLINKVFKLKE